MTLIAGKVARLINEKDTADEKDIADMDSSMASRMGLV